MPAASAVRMASPVGAETAMMAWVPRAAAFCTSSTETWPYRRDPLDESMLAAFAGTGELVERVMASDVFPQRHQTIARPPEPGRVHRLDLRVHDLGGHDRGNGGQDFRRVEAQGCLNTRHDRQGGVKTLTPHKPQPVRPSIARRRSAFASPARGASQTRASMPFSRWTTSTSTTSSRLLILPSVRLNYRSRNPRGQPGSPTSPRVSLHRKQWRLVSPPARCG